jgi:hypothetical protein
MCFTWLLGFLDSPHDSHSEGRLPSTVDGDRKLTIVLNLWDGIGRHDATRCLEKSIAGL